MIAGGICRFVAVVFLGQSCARNAAGKREHNDGGGEISHTRNCGVITICVCGEWGGNGRRIYLNVVAAQIECTAYGETPAHTSQRGGATPRTNYRKGRARARDQVQQADQHEKRRSRIT